MDFTLRNARPEDARGIAEVHVRSWQETYVGIVPQAYLDGLCVETRTDAWAKMLNFPDPGTATYVACVPDGTIMGFSNGGPAREPAYGFSGELYAIYLLRKYQGGGIGRALFFAIAAHLRENALTDMCVCVLHDNPSVGFYTHMGGAYVAHQEIERGGKTLREDLYGWRTLPER